MTTATKITLVRIVLIPVYLVCMYFAKDSETMLYVSLAVFSIASLSDLVDGKVARKYNQVSALGKFLDPLADKVLVTAAMAVFCEWGLFPAWALVVVLFREFAVSGLRMVAATNQRVIAAGWSGKVKTACTMVGLIGMMLWNGGFFYDLLGSTTVSWLNIAVVAVIAVTTLYSGVEYFIQNLDALK